MGRSSAEQAAQNRARIVEAASRQFRARGIENVSVADVMAAVGMTVGGFYKHFASKDLLVREACALSFEQALGNWKRAASRSDTATGAELIVQHYFKARPPEQTCPMIAFGPDALRENARDTKREAFAHGAEALFELFRQQVPDSGADRVSAKQASVLFAAIVGAKLLAEATNRSDWAASVMSSVAAATSEAGR